MKMKFKDLLTAFVVGSSWLVFAPFFRIFYNYGPQYHKKNCIEKNLHIKPYHFYTVAAPFYFGIMSVLGVFLSKYYSIYTAFGIVALLSATIVSTAITICDLYTFSPERLKQQYFGILKYHSFFYLVVIVGLYRFITS